MAFQVPTSSVPLLQDPPFVVALVALGTAIGYRTLRGLGAPMADVSSLERGILSAALGLGLLQYLAFSLGAMGCLTPITVWIGLGVLTLLFAPDLLRILRSVLRVPTGVHSLERWMIVGLALIAIPLAGTLLQALSPCIDADGLGYHLRAPKQWLQWGAMGYLPTVPMANTLMGVEMLYTLAMAVWSDTAAKLIHYAFGLLAMAGTYALGRRLRDARVGFAAVGAMTFPGSYSILGLFGVAYIDLGVMFELVAATLALALWRQQQARGWLLCTALCSGFVVSYKQTGIIVVMAMAVIVLRELWMNREQGVLNRRAALLWLALALLPVLPWVWRAWSMTGNPAFPMLARLFPTRDWSDGMSRTYSLYHRYYNWAVNHTSWGLAQRQRILLSLAATVAIFGALLYTRWQDRQTRPILLLTVLLTVFMLLLTGPYARFLIPLFPLYALLLFLALPNRARSSSWFVGTILTLIAVNALLYLHSARSQLRESWLVAVGRTGRDAYLQHHIALMPLWLYANRNLAPAERIAVVGIGDVYYCDRTCYVVKAYYEERIRLDTREHLLYDLRRDGINYLIASPGEEPPPFGPDTPAARNEGVLPQQIARDYGTLLLTAGGQGLYKIRQ
jgi:hypothetical protein